MNTEKVSKVLSQVLDNEELENGIEFYEELFITTLEGTPVAYVSRQDAICREYGYIVTACALFSAMWNTLSEHARHSGYVSVPTVNFLVHFMQFGYLLFVWKMGHSYAPYLVEATLHLVSRGLAFFFSPKVSEYAWLKQHSSIFYSFQENTSIVSCMRALLYGERTSDPFYWMGAIPCMPSPYPEGRCLLSDCLQSLVVVEDALHVILYHNPSNCFVAASRHEDAVPLSSQQLELLRMLAKIAQKGDLDICGYISFQHRYQLVSLVSDCIQTKEDDLKQHDWLLLFLVKREKRDEIRKKWHQHKEQWIQQLDNVPIQKDLDGAVHNPLTSNIISEHLRIPFSIHVLFYHREFQLVVCTFRHLLEKDRDNLRKVFTKEKVDEVVVHRDDESTWLCQSLGDNPPVNIVIYLQCQLDENYYPRLVKNIQKWFYRKQLSLFPHDWTEYFQSKEWNSCKWM